MSRLYGAQVKGNAGQFFFGSQFHMGSSSLTDVQAGALNVKAEERKAFELLFNVGWNFGAAYVRGRR